MVLIKQRSFFPFLLVNCVVAKVANDLHEDFTEFG
jgi:hypothetical protein